MDLTAILRGYGEGATAGLAKYPAAVVLQIARKISGDDNISYKDALALVRAQNAEAEKASPSSYMAGNILGAVHTGALTGGGGIAAQAAKTGATGAISGFTQNPEENGTTAMDVLTGGALGGALGATSGAAQKVAGALIKGAVKTRNREVAGKLVEARDALFNQRESTKRLVKAANNKTEASQAKQALQDVNSEISDVNQYINLNRASRKNYENMSDADILKKTASLTESSPLARDAVRYLKGESSMYDGLDNTIAKPFFTGSLTPIFGAAGGAFTANQMGYDPLTGAAIGAAGGAMPLLRAKMAAGAIGAQYLPPVAAQTAAKLIPQATIKQPTIVESAQVTSENPPWMDEALPQPSVKKTQAENPPWLD